MAWQAGAFSRTHRRSWWCVSLCVCVCGGRGRLLAMACRRQRQPRALDRHGRLLSCVLAGPFTSTLPRQPSTWPPTTHPPHRFFPTTLLHARCALLLPPAACLYVSSLPQQPPSPHPPWRSSRLACTSTAVAHHGGPRVERSVVGRLLLLRRTPQPAHGPAPG